MKCTGEESGHLIPHRKPGSYSYTYRHHKECLTTGDLQRHSQRAQVSVLNGFNFSLRDTQCFLQLIIEWKQKKIHIKTYWNCLSKSVKRGFCMSGVQKERGHGWLWMLTPPYWLLHIWWPFEERIQKDGKLMGTKLWKIILWIFNSVIKRGSFVKTQHAVRSHFF